ncbi:ComF family protein [Fusobacterium mortiferum]|uniref:ComF family protein n=2 Tax=Fusobacterium mortiferum TaxID=850 RepID=A0A414PRR5_FUSMR|nr:ComF family protein [Fusobacterium mortiferum ATCC 9817]MCF2628226.1 ComF family protein [Fusobacterium mortiferum]MSS61903.1 ComF family protein [Fusobacterium sp. FSA-380-WT-2B]MCF2700020.1 ComF family protein [Fusobacterium mortiferum]RGM96516.1 ComF family protein [Fusobacterium mortiferum]
MKINPMIIEGNWKEGYTLDYFMLESNYKGEDIFGYPIFDVKYSEIGKAMNELKYHKEYNKAIEIANIVTKFIKEEWKIADKIDGIIATPPTYSREIQPLFQVVKHLGENLQKPISLDFFRKLSSEELKKLPQEKKMELFKNSIIKERKLTKRGNILLVDDIFSTGATLRNLCELLKEDIYVDDIYVLTICKNIKSK